ncbi:MAG TPA: biotin carboxylase N-terminal domain-containing protein [Chloroflexota bacterium]
MSGSLPPRVRGIDSVLVANRGEIALRVFRTCRRLGIRTIAVYSDADAEALHVAMADEAVRIGPPPAAESYLNQAAILAAAAQTRAEAIHPGYGFLAENPDFAQAVVDTGRIWVGPPPMAMRRLGDKARAKALAEAHEVPVLEGYHGEDQTPGTLMRQADRIGYPLAIKATAGGGGRGMRVVDSSAAFLEGLEAAQREAAVSFGDSRVLLERYLARPRHIEIQILGDLHGSLIHLGERECSVQRRHQKLVEESPSAAVDTALRERMSTAALRLARAAGYANAGTVEFLLDETGQFAFMEVNARLQVEHPVTEAVTGQDLVELQLRAAAGEPLPLAQADVRFDGHAIEARVVAEDPVAGFLPSSGNVDLFEPPRHPQIRVDTWLRNGTPVSSYYDSLLAKVIAHCATRAEAATRLSQGLREMWVEGVKDDIDLLLAVVEHSSFRAGDLDTRFLDEHRIVECLVEVPSPVMAAASAFDHLARPDVDDPWRARLPWRVGRIQQPARWERAGQMHVASVDAQPTGEGVRVVVDGQHLSIRPGGNVGTGARLWVDGEALDVWDHRSHRVVRWQGRTYRLDRARPLSVAETARDRGSAGGAGNLSAPMPGRIVKIAIEPGQYVSQSQPLLVLDAMKMEHVIEAPHAGVVTEVRVEVGQQVAGGARLLSISSADGPSEPRTVQ